jgi:acyl phosphate:glycerol-3-phosphate acyltransferase
LNPRSETDLDVQPDLILTCAALLTLAYLLGSIPSGLLMVRLIAGSDVRQHGSGNIGMVNVFRAAGPVAGVATFVMDGLKGFVPVFLATQTELPMWAVLLVAVAAIAGHDWSIILRGRGGKGVATSVGTIGAFAPPVALISILVWVVILLVSRYASVASLLMLAFLPALLALFDYSVAIIAYSVGLLALAIYHHRVNLSRLRTGSELKVRIGPTVVRHGD